MVEGSRKLGRLGAAFFCTWYLLCTYNCTYDYIGALTGLISGLYTYSSDLLRSTMNLQVGYRDQV